MSLPVEIVFGIYLGFKLVEYLQLVGAVADAIPL